MGRSGGCCIARYSGQPEVAWKMDRIMLRFRPIAPKPTVAGSAAPAQPSASEIAASSRSGKKRCSTGGRCRARKAKKEDQSRPPPATQAEIMTLSLMPETPERMESSAAAAATTACGSSTPSPPSSELPPPYVAPAWRAAAVESRVAAAPRPGRPSGSWVTVECVTDELAVGGWASEEEVMREAKTDSCPVFISDEMEQVTWTNEPYRRMMGGLSAAAGEEEEEEEEEVSVALVTQAMVPAASKAFTCRVRVRYLCRKGKGSLAAPCDVWRLAEGGLAWRLDVAATLSLGLSR